MDIAAAGATTERIFVLLFLCPFAIFAHIESKEYTPTQPRR